MISVIVPIFNMEIYLRECLDSIIRQSYKDVEILLIDNGSTDNSFTICKEYREKDSRIRIYKESKQGPFYARKRGVIEAKGEYITFVDADDFVSIDSFEYAKEGIEKEIDVICFGINRFFNKDIIKSEQICSQKRIFDKEALEIEVYPNMIWNKDNRSFGIDPSLCNKIFKAGKIRQFFERIRTIDFHYGEDVAIIYPLIKEMDNLMICPEIYYFHRQRAKCELPDYICKEDYFEKLFLLYRWLMEKMGNQSSYREQIELFYIHSINLKKKYYKVSAYSDGEIFPFGKIAIGEKIVVFGAGNIGSLYVSQVNRLKYCDISLWVDSNYKEIGGKIKSPEMIPTVEYDHVVIAIADVRAKKQIVEQLIKMGVPYNKIII